MQIAKYAVSPIDILLGEFKRIDKIKRIIQDISIKVRIPALKPNRILRRPPAGLRIVVSGTEADQLGVAVIEPAGKPEGLEAGVGVQGNASPFIIVQALGDVAGVGVDDEPGAAQVGRRGCGR